MTGPHGWPPGRGDSFLPAFGHVVLRTAGPRSNVVLMDLANLPPAGELIEAARHAMKAGGRDAADKVLDEYAPGIDRLVNTKGAADFMGYASAGTVRRMRRRTRADGTPEWPPPDQEFGWQERHYGPGPKWAVWKIRTIVLARAEAPGRGHPGNAGKRSDWHATHVTPRQG